jgi:hypothetical protein
LQVSFGDATEEASVDLFGGAGGQYEADLDDVASETGNEEMWKITDSGLIFEVGTEKDEPDEQGEDHQVSVEVSGAKFDDVPAFKMLASIGLAKIPNEKGCGIRIHFTTSTWQIRYPTGEKQSTARTFGEHVKGKGKVSCATALLECLLWSWRQHRVKHPSCPVCTERIKMLEGALAVDLGKDLEA